MKKVLYLISRFPYPLVSGDRIRMYNISKVLAKNFKVDVFSLTDYPISKENYENYKKLFNNVYVKYIPKYFSYAKVILNLFNNQPLQVSYYYFNKVKKEILSINKKNKYDLIFCSHIRTTKYVKDINIPKVVDLVDSISLNYLRSKNLGSNFIWRLIYRLEKKKVLSYEKKNPSCFDYCFTTSKIDTNHIKKISGKDNIETIPLGVNNELLNYQNNHQDKNIISFFGKMNYNPNIDAVIYFVNDIWPKIKNRLKEAKFYVMGYRPNLKIKKLSNDKKIVVTGFLKNPYNLLSQSKIIIAPMVSGAGIQNKILEAMALGKCVITTSFGAGGIVGRDGVNFIIKDDPDEFAEEIIKLWNDKEKRTYIGQNAKKLLMENYRWDKTTEKLIKIIINLTN